MNTKSSISATDSIDLELTGAAPQSGSYGKLSELLAMKEMALYGGGKRKIESQHHQGKLTARERIELLVDKETFEEVDQFVEHKCSNFGMDSQKYLGDSVVSGFGQVNGRQAAIFSQDFTVFGGSLSKVAAEKICKIMDIAGKGGMPIIGLLDSGGARIQEGIDSLIGYGEIMLRNTRLSGVVPQISAVMGPCAGGAVYSPAITDFIFMVKETGQMYITGPSVIKSVTGEAVSFQQLGGAHTHATKSGNCHYVAENDYHCIKAIRRLLGYLPSSNREIPPNVDLGDSPRRRCDDLTTLVPENQVKAYDMKKVIYRIVDCEDFMETQATFARNIITGFARLNCQTVGIVAQQPSYKAGVLDIDASTKAARFVRFCDCFNIPLVTLVDVPGYLPGAEQEYKGIIRHGAKLLFAYAEATVPKVSVVVRKAYGGAFIAMSSKCLQGDINYSWPLAEIAVMGPEGAVNIIFKEAISQSKDPEKTRGELIEEYRIKFANPFQAAANGYLDDIIDPRSTRIKIIKALSILKTKKEPYPQKKHGNIPL